MQSGGSWRKCAGKSQVILVAGTVDGTTVAVRDFIYVSRKIAPEFHKEILKLGDEWREGDSVLSTCL